MDRFFLGGGCDLRGFTLRSVGPKAGADTMGGNTFWVCLVILLRCGLFSMPAGLSVGYPFLSYFGTSFHRCLLVSLVACCELVGCNIG